MDTARQVSIDRVGRVLIPEAIRQRLGLSPGTRLMIEDRDNREILLRPLPEEPQLINKGGVLVVRSQATGEITGVEKREREARVTELMGRAGL